jgi:hypothetical protein
MQLFSAGDLDVYLAGTGTVLVKIRAWDVYVQVWCTISSSFSATIICTCVLYIAIPLRYVHVNALRKGQGKFV